MNIPNYFEKKVCFVKMISTHSDSSPFIPAHYVYSIAFASQAQVSAPALEALQGEPIQHAALSAS